LVIIKRFFQLFRSQCHFGFPVIKTNVITLTTGVKA
jgi:hypothetical protein